MKKLYYLVLPALLIALFLPTASYAKDGSDDDFEDHSSSSSEVEVEIEVEHEDERTSSSPFNIREKLRMSVDDGSFREDTRDKLIERAANGIREIASSTRAEHMEIREEYLEDSSKIRAEYREKISSSTDDRGEIRTKVRLDIFETHKISLVRQLNLSLKNLQQIYERVASRIDKAAEAGHDMASARELLNIADVALTDAETAIQSVTSLSVSASTTATTSVDLTRPREIGSQAIQALKDARRALVETVRAIAQALGIRADTEQSTSAEATTTLE